MIRSWLSSLPAAPAGEPTSHLGDVWILGRDRHLCGDALDPAAYTVLMGGKKADMIFTDCPYNVKIDGLTRRGLAGSSVFLAGKLISPHFVVERLFR